MAKYKPVQLRRMARLTLAAKECGDFRYTELLMRLVLATGLSSGEITTRLTEYAQAPG